MTRDWMDKWFDADGTPRAVAKMFIEEAWEIARIVAEVDKQLLSTEAVGRFADLAGAAYKLGQSEARRTALEEAMRLMCLGCARHDPYDPSSGWHFLKMDNLPSQQCKSLSIRRLAEKEQG